MRKKFKWFIEEHNLIPHKSKILLAVSGGIDSMVMLHLFYDCGYNIAVAHCNFSLRGAESDADEHLVRETCLKLGISFFVKRFNTADYAQNLNLSIQVAARNLRYNYFEELCVEHNFSVVAVAHNKNDNAETMLINLARGTGLKGLTGIKPKNSNIIRPLLFALRSEIDSYANEKGIEYRVDSSNAKVKYARNRIRHKVIPELQQINEGVIENLYSSSLFLDQAWQAINIMNIAFRNETRSIVGPEVHYSINKLLNYPFRQLFLVEELAEFGFSAAMVLDIDKSLFTQPGKLFHAANYTLIRDRESLIVCPIVDTKSETVQIESSTQGISSPITLQFSTIGIETKGKYHISKSSAIGAFDYAKLTFPLTLRPWRIGDWFIPFGMKGRKKISDFLVDLKIPVHQKDSVYVLESNGNIAWVVGYRIDDRFKIESSTQTVFEIVKGVMVDS